MVTETMLKSAATEANVAKMAFLDRLDVKLHVFSEKFEKKIGKLVRRAKHPMLYKILRYGVVVLLVAAVLLALCGIFCNPEQTAPGEAQRLYDYYLPSEPPVKPFPARSVYVSQTLSLLSHPYRYKQHGDDCP